MAAFAEPSGAYCERNSHDEYAQQEEDTRIDGGIEVVQGGGEPSGMPASVHQSRFVLSPKEARTALRLTRTPAGVSMIDPPVSLPGAVASRYSKVL